MDHNRVAPCTFLDNLEVARYKNIIGLGSSSIACGWYDVSETHF